MKAGVVYPQIELGGDTGAVKAFAQAAEDLGYDHIVIYDHVLGAVHAGSEPKLTGPYKETDPFHEPLVTYAYLAGVTKKLELVTGVIILPQRQTALFAKQAADVDLFSDGRLRLGVGVGWNWVEFDGLEMHDHFRRRGRRQEHQIALIRKLWEEPVVDHEDRDHRIDRAGILPRPKRQIPIWLRRLQRGRVSTGQPGSATDFCFGARTQTEAVQNKVRIEAKLSAVGRDAETFGFEFVQQYSRGDNQWPGDIAGWRKAGGSHISVGDDGRKPHDGGRPYRSHQAVARRLQLGLGAPIPTAGKPFVPHRPRCRADQVTGMGHQDQFRPRSLSSRERPRMPLFAVDDQATRLKMRWATKASGAIGTGPWPRARKASPTDGRQIRTYPPSIMCRTAR